MDKMGPTDPVPTASLTEPMDHMPLRHDNNSINESYNEIMVIEAASQRGMSTPLAFTFLGGSRRRSATSACRDFVYICKRVYLEEGWGDSYTFYYPNGHKIKEKVRLIFSSITVYRGEPRISSVSCNWSEGSDTRRIKFRVYGKYYRADGPAEIRANQK